MMFQYKIQTICAPIPIQRIGVSKHTITNTINVLLRSSDTIIPETMNESGQEQDQVGGANSEY